MPKSKELRNRAWQALSEGAYWPYVGAIIVLSLIAVAIVVPVIIVFVLVACFCEGVSEDALVPISGLIGCLAAIPIIYYVGLSTYSCARMSLAVMRREMKFELFWSGWGHGWKMLWLILVQSMYIQLWAILFIIPGIVKAFSYSMAEFVAVDHPEWTANQCITESRRLMRGNKWRFLCLGCSFIGWGILAMFASMIPYTCGLAQHFLTPYFSSAFAAFYEELKARAESPRDAAAIPAEEFTGYI